jgi:hypothetical protein
MTIMNISKNGRRGNRVEAIAVAVAWAAFAWVATVLAGNEPVAAGSSGPAWHPHQAKSRRL